MSKLKGKLSRPKKNWIFWILAVIFLVFILPPLVKAAVAATKGVKDLTEGVTKFAGGLISGVGDQVQGLLSIVGLMDSPLAGSLEQYRNPSIDSCFDRNYWRDKLTSEDSIKESCDLYYPVELDKLFHWYGYNVSDTLTWLASDMVGSKINFSYLQHWCLVNKGETFIKWLNSGWWCFMSDRDQLKVCKFIETLPES